MLLQLLRQLRLLLMQLLRHQLRLLQHQHQKSQVAGFPQQKALPATKGNIRMG
jgi:hypothetical protein